MTQHKPVLIREVLRFLNPQKDQNFIDCTLGGGGHAEAILELTGPSGKLLGIDWDSQAVKTAKQRLSRFKNRCTLINASYIEVKQIAYEKEFFPIHGVLLDLGLSSDQLQDSGRGFSFQVNEPLDMRYSTEENELTAEQIINLWPEEKIKQLLIENAEEQFAGRIARNIVARRQKQKILTTLDLVGILVKCVPARKTRIHPATKTFQALRMEVNHELANIKSVLQDIFEIAGPGTKIGVISFHSLEDKIVKQFFKEKSKGCICPIELPVCRCEHEAEIKVLTKKPIIPTLEEIAENFRSRSAKLRVAEKI